MPATDDATLLELLVLEAAQSGLSWAIVLAKRDGYRDLFHQFDLDAVAAMTPADVDRLVLDPRIIRHRGKVEAAIACGQAAVAARDEHGSLHALFHMLVGSDVRSRGPRSLADVPSSDAVSLRVSKELKRRGFRFVGPTTCYSFLQAAGFVNDHVRACHRHDDVARAIGLVHGSTVA